MASTLLAAVQQGESQQLQKNIGAGAALVSRAIDEGFVRLAVAKRKALERAQEQLSATTISAGGHEPPHVPTGDFSTLHLQSYLQADCSNCAKALGGLAYISVAKESSALILDICSKCKVCIGFAGSTSDDWLEDIRDEWIQVVRTTTQLAKGDPDFAAEIKKLTPLWSDDGGVHAWADVASDLQDLRQAVAGRSSS